MTRRKKRTLPIWKLKNPAEAVILRRTADPVTLEVLLQPDTQALIDAMIPSMHAAHGIGLAAPQVGQALRIAVIGREVTNGLDEVVIVNPSVQPIGTDSATLEEGCLSIPRVYGLVPRSRRVRLHALNRTGQPFELVAEDVFARVIQHEVDHLNGRLFIDRASAYTHGHPPRTA